MTTPEQWIVFGIFAIIAVGLLFLAALAGAGRFGEMPEPVVDQFIPELPDRPLTPDDLRAAQFGLTLRGYSPQQVDRLLAHAAQQWDADRDDTTRWERTP